MADTAFNTIAEVQRLRDAGFAQAQAEAITLSIHAGVTGGVATKADLGGLRADLGKQGAELHGEIAALDAKIEKQGAALDAKIDKQGAVLEANISVAKFDLTWRLLGGIAVLNGMLLAAMRLLPPG